MLAEIGSLFTALFLISYLLTKPFTYLNYKLNLLNEIYVLEENKENTEVLKEHIIKSRNRIFKINKQ